MQTFKKSAAQGDVLLVRINDIPDDIEVEEQKPEDGLNILAHSETGHHHTMPADSTALFAVKGGDGLTAFLVVKQESVLRHHRSWDTHEPISVSPGTYRIKRHAEYTPEGYRPAPD